MSDKGDPTGLLNQFDLSGYHDGIYVALKDDPTHSRTTFTAAYNSLYQEDDHRTISYYK